jgi:DNA ligase (NAD+)
MCPDQALRRVIYFAGKEAMDIENMGEKVVEQLIEKGFVKRASDIYTLTEKELAQLDGFKEKAVERLLQGIEKSKTVTLAKFIMALGIKHVGSETAELLASKSGDIHALIKMSKEDLVDIAGIGEKVADAIQSFFANKENIDEIERLLALGVKPQAVEVVRYAGHPFEGKNFVLTGTLEKYTRDTAAGLIKERGGKVVGSVSKNTDYVLAGDNPGSKLEKAKKFGVAVLSETEFDAKLYT